MKTQAVGKFQKRLEGKIRKLDFNFTEFGKTRVRISILLTIRIIKINGLCLNILTGLVHHLMDGLETLTL
jgi:hypothetical protein